MEWETDGDTVTGSGRIDEDDRKGTAAAGRSLSTDAALAISSSLIPRASLGLCYGHTLVALHDVLVMLENIGSHKEK